MSDFPDFPALPEGYEHDPGLEPYASMGRDELLGLMREAEGDPSEWAKLNEFLLDKMTTRELVANNHSTRLATFLMYEYKPRGLEQCRFLCHLAGQLARLIDEDMPPPGPLHEVN